MKKSLSALALLTCLILALTACSLSSVMKGNIKGGTWEGDTFTNTWSDLKFTLPEGYACLSAAEMSETFAAGQEIMVNEGVTSDAQYNFASMKTLYDCLVTTSDGASNLIICYENLLLGSQKTLTAEGYYNILKGQLETVSEMGYTFATPTEATVAGQTYFVGHVTGLEGALFQDFYIRKHDNAMVVLIVSSIEETRADTISFVESIQRAN